jgi:S1-C subfamily serine protease
VTDTSFEGLPVLFITPDSPSDKAGIKVGDRILFANGVRIDSAEAYVKARGVNPSRMEVTLQRGNQILDVSYDLPTQPS